MVLSVILHVERLKQSIKFRIWLGVVIAAALFSVWITLNLASENPFYKGSPSNFVAREATLIIDFGEGGKRLFAGSTIEGMNVYHALLASSRAGNFEIIMVPSGEGGGVVVDEIDGTRNTDTRVWQYYFNGEYKNALSPQAQPIQSGDKVVFKYE